MTARLPFSRLILAKSGAFRSRSYPKTHSSEEELLWRAVIDKAMLDIGDRNPRIREEAINWFDICNEDFLEVCRLADIWPEEIFKFLDKHESILAYDDTVEIDVTIYFKIKRKRTLRGKRVLKNDRNKISQPVQR